MTLAMLAAVYTRLGSVHDHVLKIWKLVAFLGRYGHQPADVCLRLTNRELAQLADGISEIMREEADAMKRANNG